MTKQQQEELFETIETAEKSCCKGTIQDVKFGRYLSNVNLFGDYTVEKLEKIIGELKKVNKIRQALFDAAPKPAGPKEIKDKITLL